MVTPGVYLFALLLGIASTLPLGPSGMCIVSAFALKGSKSGRQALSGLLLAEVLFMATALMLRYLGILALNHSVEVFFTMIFSLFLIVFGFKTFKSRKVEEAQFPSSFSKIFGLSVMNPTILLFYLGLLIMAEKKLGPDLSWGPIVSLGAVFLIGVISTLLILGEIAQRRCDFIKNNMVNIKVVIGPLFMIMGFSSAIFSL
jgi:threonine/homoserine/homoserine lactone efflux protein